MAKEIKWERLTPTEAETLSALVKSGKTVYAAPIEIEKNKEDRQRQFEALNITQDNCTTWRIGSDEKKKGFSPARSVMAPDSRNPLISGFFSPALCISCQQNYGLDVARVNRIAVT